MQFYSTNKLEKLVHLVGFIIRIYHDARSPERVMLVHSDIKMCITHFTWKIPYFRESWPYLRLLVQQDYTRLQSHAEDNSP